MQAIVAEVMKGLRMAVDTRADLTSNPMSIVAIGMELMNKYPKLSGTEKRNLLIKALTTLASGPDGILGTADDTIPKPVVDTLTNLIQGNMIHDIIGLVADITKGKFRPEKVTAIASACSGCLGLLASRKAASKYT